MTGLERLDRLAEAFDIELARSGSRRTFALNGRVITFRPVRSGVFRIEARIDGQLDAVQHGSEGRVEQLLHTKHLTTKKEQS